MKPHSGKRVDPQCRPGEFSSECPCYRVAWDPLWTSPRGPCTALRVHFLRAECHDRFCVQSDARREGDRPLDGVIARRCGLAAGPRTLAASVGPRTSSLARLWRTVFAVRRDRWGASVRVSPRRPWSVANRSVLHPTRLETRTKESNMCASHGVQRNPKAQ